jgi:RND superfamily putative drug exporter
MLYSGFMRAFSLFVTRRPWLVLALWGLAALLSVPFAARAPAALSANPGSLQDSDGRRVINILRERFGEVDTNTVLLVTRSTPPLSTAQGKAAYDKFVQGLEGVQGVTRVLRQDAQTTLPTRAEDGVLALTVAQIPLEDGATETLGRVR